MISHIVLFNPKDGLTAKEILLFAQYLHRAMTSIPCVRRATVGRRIDAQNGSTSNVGDVTYKYAAVIEFDDRDGLVAYLTDPIHRELARIFWESCGSTVVTDVEAVDAKSTEVIDLLVMSQKIG